MNKLSKILLSVIVGIAFVSFLRGHTNDSLTKNLPPIEKAELLKLKKSGDLWTGEIEQQKLLAGDPARVVVDIWRNLPSSENSAICHFPGYGIKFYSEDSVILYATICFDCHNIEFLIPKGDKYVSFDADGEMGQKLLAILETNLSAKY